MKSPQTNKHRASSAARGVVVVCAALSVALPMMRAVGEPSPPVAAPTELADGSGDPAWLLTSLTLGLYRTALDHQESCALIASSIESYLDTHEAAFIAALAALQKRVTDEGAPAIAALATYFDEALVAHPLIKEGQAAIYACIRAKEAQGKKRPLAKLMQRFYTYHDALLRQLLGPVE